MRFGTVPLVLVILIGVSIGTGANSSSSVSTRSVVSSSESGGGVSRGDTRRSPSPRACQMARRGVAFYSGRIVDWLEQTGTPAATLRPRRLMSRCPRYLGRVLRLKAYALRREVEALEARLLVKWRCIHSKEGAWNSNTGNGYYGGLQMDYSFMSAHGADFLRRWGPAHRWPVVSQLIVAERAYHGTRTSSSGFWRDDPRGFGPWPNTRRMCGV